MEGRVFFLVLFLVTFCYGQGVNFCPGYGGSSSCVKPSNYTTFTRLTVSDIVADIRFYFPSSPYPPPSEFTSDTRAIPTITFNQAGPLRVVFLFEGAGYRNQLGYFTFTGTPPNIQVTSQQLLFPDINDACIYAGMQVTTPIIPAGTQIGFYLLADGCNVGQTNANKYYTLSQLNSPDQNIRHTGLYVDYFRELLIIGFEDLTKATWDNDFEDTMFIFDAEGLVIDFGALPYACTNPPCKNGGICDYNTGNCDCSRSKYMLPGCVVCNCSDNNPCTNDICNGAQCTKTIWSASIDSCVAAQSCSNPPITCPTIYPTTAQATTAIPTTAIPTTAVPTTGVPTTAQSTTGQPSSIAPTTAQGTTADPTTAVPTTGDPTTAFPTTGEERLTNTNRPQTNPTTAVPVVNTVSFFHESSASLIQFSTLIVLVAFLVC